MQSDTTHIQETMAKRTAKNSVFLDLFQNKSYLLKLYQTLHPEDYESGKDRNVLREYLAGREKEVVTIMMSLFDEEQIMKSFIRSERHDADRETAERLIRKKK